MYRKQALRILDRVRRGFDHEHTFNVVRPEDFKHVSISFYANAQRSLEQLGFIHVADVEDGTLRQQKPDPRSFLRIMTSSEGTVNAIAWQLCPFVLWRLLIFLTGVRTKVVEFQTELEDRTQIITTTEKSQHVFPSSPKLFRNFQPADTLLEDLYRSHNEIVDRVTMKSDASPIRYANINEILESQNRGIALQREYLESIGWVTEEYLLNNGANKRTAKALLAEIRSILEEERSRKDDPLEGTV